MYLTLHQAARRAGVKPKALLILIERRMLAADWTTYGWVMNSKDVDNAAPLLTSPAIVGRYAPARG